MNSRMLYAVAKANPFLMSKEIAALDAEQTVTDTQSLITGLSELELALLLSAARAEIKLDTDIINFNLAYDEYLHISNQLKHERSLMVRETGASVGYRIFSKEVARSSWERLQQLDLILPQSSYGDLKKGSTIRDELKMVKIDVTLLELAAVIGRSHILAGWTRI